MRRIFLSSIILLFILVGCSQKDSSDWYDSKEKAIEAGLKQEGTDASAVLSVEKYEEETIVFFDYDGALSIANLVESNKGYSWVRLEPYFDFDVEGSSLPYTTAGFDFETKEGSKGSVLYGKVYDESIKKLILIGDGAEKELMIFEDSKLFYTIHRQPFTSLEVIPVKE
ncbi:hypothetical protein SLU01_10560 [Sporosarcina luteola]|uniref:Lipoprotein n=1 Tax=Sporosarcina luteola TaxID=582850 RepID=A0A511Z5M2_9BACL|nr:hypothetical protein [Sporosarcina luteola]GEN82744.1 hypothetical protein SLU01_10560 [Sporosarcina luteola]